MADTKLQELLDEAVASNLGSLHVGAVGTIQSYDHDKQLANVQPVVRTRFVDADTGESEYIQPPVIPNVPVAFPSGSGGSITWPLSEGDTVYLAHPDRSHDEWQATAKDDVTPEDPRRFDLSDAIAIPGVRAPADPLDEVDAGALVIASNEIHLGTAGLGATDYIALANLVKSELDSLQSTLDTLINAFNGHTHATPAGPSGPPVPIPTVSQNGPVGDVKSSKVKSE